MSEVIRVLHVLTNMSYGGIENLLMSLYRNIDRSKIQFDFLTHFSDAQDFEEEIKSLGGNLYRLPALNPFSRKYKKALSDFFTEHKEYKIVHSHLNCMSGIILKEAKRHGINVRIAHSHSSSQNHNWKYLIKLMYMRMIPKYATALFACSEIAGEWMFRGEPFTVLRNAIKAKDFSYDVEKSRAVKEQLNIKDNFVIAHVGQFRAEKNHLFLMEIFNELLKNCENSVLLLVGKGRLMEEVKQKARDLGIESRVHFLGARSDVDSVLQAADVFVLPSKYEGLPVSVVEAQASGLPCVVTDYVPDVCSEITGNVVRLSSEESAELWANEILKFKGFKRLDTYDKICKAGFDITENAEWLEGYYLDAVK